jgi:uncharacterized protein YuzE
MKEPVIKYDEISDSLYITFDVGKPATGIELNDQILLRIDKDNRKAVGITIFDYSVMSQKTEIGPRSFPLDGLNELSYDTRKIVYEILLTHPVNEFLYLSAYCPANIENIIPITMIRSRDRIENYKRGCPRRGQSASSV